MKFQSVLQCELALKILHEKARYITRNTGYNHMESSYALSSCRDERAAQRLEAGGWRKASRSE